METRCEKIKQAAWRKELRAAKKYYPKNVYAVCGVNAIYARYVKYDGPRGKKHIYWNPWVRVPQRDLAQLKANLRTGKSTYGHHFVKK